MNVKFKVVCKICNSSFYAGTTNAKYCSEECRKKKYTKEQWNEYQRNWRRRNPEKARFNDKKTKQKNIGRIRDYRRVWVLRVKTEVLTHYGRGKLECTLCGEKRLPCLSIDHINGGGTRHMKSLNKFGQRFYRYLKTESFPSGYRTLCMNCQFMERARLREAKKPDASPPAQ